MPQGGVHSLNERTFLQWYYSQPLITRTLATIYVFTGLTLMLGILPVKYMIHDWGYIFKLPVPEVWRLVTNFGIIGAPSFMFLFRLVWLFQYGGSYEQAKFSHNTADAITLLAFLMTSTTLIDLLLPPFRSYIHGPTIIFALIYLWSKQNPTAPISLFGLIKLQALYLPFAFMGITVLQGGSPFPELLGILVGHFYYFLTDIYPVQSGSGRVLIKSPQWLMRRMYKYNIGRVPDQRGAAVNPSDVTFRAFSGRPRRLAD